MGTLLNTAKGGSNGTTVTTANSGGNSGASIDTVNIAGTTPTLTFSTAQVPRGAGTSYALGAAGSCSSYLMWRNSGGTQNSLTFPGTTMWAVGYFYFVSSIPTIGRMMQLTNASIQLQGGVGVNASDKLTVVNSAGTAVNTSSTTLPIGAWFRVEMQVFSSSTVGWMVVRIYTSPDSVTPTETITTATNLNTRGGNIAAVVYGYPTTTSTSTTLYLDGLGVSSDGWLGPTQLTNGALL